MQKAFSLIELSIVLVILGLLTGGILAGQSLIRAAELRAVSTEFSRYHTAIQTFRDKYFAIPGDFRDATRFWQRQSSSNCTTNSSATVNTAGTCDGSGDGLITQGAAVSVSAEFAQFYRQLALAGLIEGSYSGLAGPSNVWHAVPGQNVPASKLANATWAAVWWQTQPGSSTMLFNGNYGNTLVIGKATTAEPSDGILKPEEAWNIDTKTDDGKPATGSTVVRGRGNFCTVAADGVTGLANGNTSHAAMMDAGYNLGYSDTACGLVFRGFY